MPTLCLQVSAGCVKSILRAQRFSHHCRFSVIIFFFSLFSIQAVNQYILSQIKDFDLGLFTPVGEIL